jgi:outer membrane lipoprotein LolB
MNKAVYYCVIAFSLLQLSACQLLQTKPASSPQSLSEWSIRGKLAIKTPDESVVGYLSWNQTKQDYQIIISGPLGQGTTDIKGSNDQVTLSNAQIGTVSADTPEQLIEEQLGWKFPITNIAHWIKGKASPQSPSTKSLGSNGDIEELQQDNWDVTFSRYQNHAGYRLPGRIKLHQQPYTFTLIVKEWSL